MGTATRWQANLLKIFGVPPGARRAKPFIDHVLTFAILDNKIWFRNYQVRWKYDCKVAEVLICC